MQDGGMGSVRFATAGASKAISGDPLSEAEYVYEDGVVVIIAINGDVDSQIREIDFWKVDFSPLRRYPTPSDLRIKS
jgi:hypothetical protein